MDLRIAARKSDLARLQAYQVGDLLEKKGVSVDYYFRSSLGDQNQEDPLWKMPEKGVFTEDFREGLINGDWDMVVHSWKDLPVDIGEGTEIVATLPRADVRDLFLIKKSHFSKIQTSKKLTVFSSSPRRIYNLTPFFKKFLPFAVDEVMFENVRGNINTRIKKMLESEDVDGLIVAKAAIDRMLSAQRDEFSQSQREIRAALKDCEFQVLPLSENPTAAAQGALAVEISEKRSDLKNLLSQINCQKTWDSVCLERQILKSHGGGCHQKIGVSHLVRDFGEITYLRGETEEGVILNKTSFSLDVESLEKPFIGTLDLYRSQDIHYQRPSESQAHFVAKSRAIPENETYRDQVVWAAGLKTWEKLAQRGHWVHGCSESLGEREDFRLSVIRPHSQWAKWTHSGGEAGESEFLVKTYELLPQKNDLRFLKDYKEFFWTSGSQFELCVKEVPEIAGARHFCGPGHTFTRVSKVLKDMGINKPPQILPHYEYWLELAKK